MAASGLQCAAKGAAHASIVMAMIRPARAHQAQETPDAQPCPRGACRGIRRLDGADEASDLQISDQQRDEALRHVAVIGEFIGEGFVPKASDKQREDGAASCLGQGLGKLSAGIRCRRATEKDRPIGQDALQQRRPEGFEIGGEPFPFERSRQRLCCNRAIACDHAGKQACLAAVPPVKRFVGRPRAAGDLQHGGAAEPAFGKHLILGLKGTKFSCPPSAPMEHFGMIA